MEEYVVSRGYCDCVSIYCVLGGVMLEVGEEFMF